MVGDLDREKILPYKDKKKNSFANNYLFLKLQLNVNYLNLEKIFNDSFKFYKRIWSIL